MDFGNRLKSLRTQNHVTQTQLAIYLNISRATIAGYETKHHQPAYEQLIQIANYFHVSIDYLVTGIQKTELTQIENEILSVCLCLTEEGKQNLLRYAQFLQSCSAQKRRRLNDS